MSHHAGAGLFLSLSFVLLFRRSPPAWSVAEFDRRPILMSHHAGAGLFLSLSFVLLFPGGLSFIAAMP